MKQTYRLAAFADEADPSLEGQIKALSENHIPLIELRGVDGRNISAYTPAQAEKIASQLAKEGIGVFSIGSPIGKTAIDSDFEEHFRSFENILDIACATGARCIRLFSFYNSERAGQDAGRIVAERLARFVQAADRKGVTVCHENEKGIYGDNEERCLELLSAVPSMMGVFDPANFVQCGVDTLKAWELLKGRTLYLHIKDADADGRVVPAGQGRGNLEFIVKDFLKGGGEVMTIEPHLHSFIGLSALSESDAENAEGSLRFKGPREAFDYAVSALRRITDMTAEAEA